MKLSEAIREGIKRTEKQIFGEYIDENGGACALGTAFFCLTDIAPKKYISDSKYKIIDKDMIDDIEEILEKTFTITNKKFLCKEKNCNYHIKDTKLSIIAYTIHLNDDHKLSREEIADILEKEGE